MEIGIDCGGVGNGTGSAIIYGCDLTHGYIAENVSLERCMIILLLKSREYTQLTHVSQFAFQTWNRLIIGPRASLFKIGG